MTIDKRPKPQPKPGEIRIRSHLVGICGSDVHGWTGMSGRRIAPMIMGHELSGEVSALGEGTSGFAVGDRVTVQPILPCWTCDYCQAGVNNICPTRECLGVMQYDGAFAEEFCVPARNVIPLPDSVSDEVGALIEPFAVAYRAVSLAAPVGGKTAMVCGSGPIGLMLLKVLKMLGAGRVIMVDLADFRLELARKHGADITINPAAEPMDEAFRRLGLHNRVDIAFEAVGLTPTVQQTVDYVKNRGQIIWVGNSAPMVTLNMQHVVTRELNIQGSYVYSQEDFVRCVDLLGRTTVDFSGIISKIIPLGETQAMFETLSQGAGELIKVLVDVRR